MSIVNLTVGGVGQIATITAIDTNGNTINPGLLTYGYSAGTAGVVAESGTSFNTPNQFNISPLAVGSTTMTWTAKFSTGGPTVSAPQDTAAVTQAGIASVSVTYAPA